MLRHLLLASVASMAVMPFAAPAHAACSTAKPASDATVTCTGTDTTGVKNSSANGVSLTVAQGASVSNAKKTDNHTIHLDNDASITLKGTVTSVSEKDAVHVSNDADIALEGATILTTDAESDGIQADSGLTLRIDAASSITAGKKGLNSGDGDNSKVINHGTISAGTEGVELGDSGYVENHGTIEALDDAINSGERSTIINYGLIHSKLDGLGVDFVQDGIDLDSGVIVNHGTILSDDDAAIDFDATKYNDEASTITNTGLIKGAAGIIVETGHNDDGSLNGEAANEATQHVVNSGVIEATGGTALKLGAGVDIYEGLPGSKLVGAALMGEGDDIFRVSTGAEFGDVFLGAGDDSFIVTDALTAVTLAGVFGVIDGGTGANVASFLGYTSSEIASHAWLGDLLDLTFVDGLALSLRNFGSFAFTDTTLTAADLSAVPLPAPALMLLTALAGLGAVRMRRRS